MTRDPDRYPDATHNASFVVSYVNASRDDFFVSFWNTAFWRSLSDLITSCRAIFHILTYYAVT